MKDHALLELESRKSFDFFWNETNTDKSSRGYGLIRDRADCEAIKASSCEGRQKSQQGCVMCTDISSIASVGFGLSALPIGAERGWISREEALERADGTLKTLLYHCDHVNGFFYHFLCMNTAKRARKSEVSIIDTAILLTGAIVAGEYFGGRIMETARLLYERAVWSWYRDSSNNLFYMGYTPEKGFSGWWDFYAEQLMAYILGAGSPTYPVPGDMFYSFACYSADQGREREFIQSWFGSLFTYQFSHAWVDFRGKRDQRGIDWWENSIKATLENRAYCIEMSKTYKTLHENSWGLTSCDGPFGYQGRYGAAPSALLDDEHIVDGTVPPAGAAGSIVFTPDESIQALEYYYSNHPRLWGKYGFLDAYNLDVIPHWYSEHVIGINKGITLLMIENYRTGLVWDLFMKNPWVKNGIKAVGLEDYVQNAHIA